MNTQKNHDCSTQLEWISGDEVLNIIINWLNIALCVGIFVLSIGVLVLVAGIRKKWKNFLNLTPILFLIFSITWMVLSY